MLTLRSSLILTRTICTRIAGVTNAALSSDLLFALKYIFRIA